MPKAKKLFPSTVPKILYFSTSIIFCVDFSASIFFKVILFFIVIGNKGVSFQIISTTVSPPLPPPASVWALRGPRGQLESSPGARNAMRWEVRAGLLDPLFPSGITQFRSDRTPRQPRAADSRRTPRRAAAGGLAARSAAGRGGASVSPLQARPGGIQPQPYATRETYCLIAEGGAGRPHSSPACTIGGQP